MLQALRTAHVAWEASTEEAAGSKMVNSDEGRMANGDKGSPAQVQLTCCSAVSFTLFHMRYFVRARY